MLTIRSKEMDGNASSISISASGEPVAAVGVGASADVGDRDTAGCESGDDALFVHTIATNATSKLTRIFFIAPLYRSLDDWSSSVMPVIIARGRQTDCRVVFEESSTSYD